jgi:hypothetical protein
MWKIPPWTWKAQRPVQDREGRCHSTRQTTSPTPSYHTWELVLNLEGRRGLVHCWS